MEQEVYRVSEFCQRYAISRTAFYREIWTGKLQIIKRGKRTLITRVEAENWLQKLKESSTVRSARKEN